MNCPPNRLCLLAILLTSLAAPSARAFVQTADSFDTNWPGVTGTGWTGFSNDVVNPVSGWRVNLVRIYTTAANSSPYGAMMQTTSSPPFSAWVQTSLLTNGIGSLVFSTRNVTSGRTNLFAIEYSPDALSWSSSGTVTNSLTAFTTFTNTLNTFSNGYLRVRKTTEGPGQAAYVDDFSVTTPRPVVTVSNVAVVPGSPQNGDSVYVTANIGVQGFYQTLTPIAWWKDAFGSWTSIAMSTNAQGLYVSASPIPARPPGSTVSYYVSTTYTTEEGSFVTNLPSATAPYAYTVRERSAYTNVSVVGSINTNLLLVAPGTWQGAIPAPGLLNPAIRFRTASNGVTTLYGESNQSVFTLPVYGQAESGAGTILMSGTVSTPIVFNFSEQSGEYNIQKCVYENFDGWTSRPFGVYTNNGWILRDGAVTNDAALAFRGSSAVLNGRPNASTNSTLISPYLTNGIGQIAIWYRSFETTGAPPASILIERAVSPAATNWTPIPGTVTNTTATNYVYLTVGVSDRDNHAIRIVNNAAGTNARVCIDEIVVCEPGSGIVVDSLTNSPGSPTVLDDVNIIANINAVGGATSLQAQLWYRFGTSGVFDAVAMVNDVTNRFVTVSPLPHADLSPVQYYIECSYTGFLSAASSPAMFPAAGPAAPYFYQPTGPANRSEYFDTNWPGVSGTGWTGFSNDVVNPVSGWGVNQVRIYSSARNSDPYGAMMQTTSSPPFSAWIQSPYLTNVIGKLTFDMRNVTGNRTVTIDVEYSEDGLSWATHAVITNTSGATPVFVRQTNIMYGLTNGYIRLRKSVEGAGLACYIDSIDVTYPSAQVIVTNVFINPGYPSAADTVNVSCTVTSINALFPAVNIAPTLYYRKAGTVPFSTVTMLRTAGTTYATTATIPAFPRDTKIEYYVRCDFNGYHSSAAENLSPAFYPAAGSATPSSYTVRPFASAYDTVAATVNGTQAVARLLNDRTWQAVAQINTLTNRLTINFSGSGYSAGMGYATNDTAWGNTNAAWQTALPLADTASTGQAPFSINGSFQGQYTIRFDEIARTYEVRQCVWQDFDTWSGTGGKYILSANDTIPPSTLNFDTWPTNETRVRRADFEGPLWAALTSYTNAGFGDDIGYAIYGSRVEQSGNYRVRTTNNAAMGVGFVIQAGQLGTAVSVLRGVGTVSYIMRPTATNPPCTFGIYLFPTNRVDDEMSYRNEAYWQGPYAEQAGLTNIAAYVSNSVTINTSQTYTVIFAHTAGDQSMYIDDLSVSEWYADTKTSNGWTAAESWIEPTPRSGGIRTCRFDITRADPGAEQYVQSPIMTKGVNKITFKYGAGNTSPVSFDVIVSYGDPNTWTNVIASVTNTFSAQEAEAVYKDFSYPLLSTASNIYVRIRNKTPAPGILLLDDIEISSYALTGDWEANNVAIEPTPGVRQYYLRAAYLNSNRVSEIWTPTPLTNLPPYIRSPYLAPGIGEVSFWYRNWTASGTAVPPAKLVIQKSAVSSTNDSDWYPVSVITNIVNTNDYLYYRTTLYDTDNHYIRIYNDDTGTTARVCLDDILIAAPLAATVSMTNLTTIPQQPVYTDTVAVVVDLYNLFLSPSNIHVKAYYATAGTHAGLGAAAPVYLGEMSCIASNPGTPGQWYRYKTTQQSIPAHPTDTFVRYFVTADYEGLQSASLTPKTNQTFGIYPSWYDPMNAEYGTSMAYYVAYSCPTGSVWFNEINYIDYFDDYCWTNEYVELCGPAGASIRNWRIEVYDENALQVDGYTITNGYTLPNATNGHGFWLLGDPGVANVSMVFTGAVAIFNPAQNLPYGGGLVLKRSFGAIEHKVAFGADVSGFPPSIGNDTAIYNAGAFCMVGTGANRQDFTWQEKEGFTPGGPNSGQTLVGQYTQVNEPPTILITAFWGSGTSVWIVCSRTNGWYPTAWVSTNLMSSSAWTNARVISSVLSATNATLQCATNRVSPAFYRIMATNSP